ncbi:tyrosine-type recombinase/integrase [Parabacteroides sp. AF17-3]|uniref:tyrosine-type recombinase/integrase n=1 Tax=Parabacteroides sp. AF17-3 TaxID=2293113 RepID=UPI001314EC29
MLDIPLQIIEKYKKDRVCEKIFSVPGYSIVDINLKYIVEICDINKSLTYHQSRHSFGTSICLTQGVTIEILSQMMGHRNIKTTQIYAEITGAKIEEDIQRLSQKIEDCYRLAGSQYKL